MQTQTFTFQVWTSASALYESTPPTSYSTWSTVQTPDLIAAGQAMVSGPNYQLGEATGAVQTAHALPTFNPNVPALTLAYSSTAADARPIFVTHYQLDPTLAAPATITAQLTLNGTAGTAIYYNTSLLNPGDLVNVALQGDATSLATGRYSYAIAVTANYTTPVTTTYTGSVDIVNENSSPFGSGWTLANMGRLWAVTGGVFIEGADGVSTWFANGMTSGTFVTPASQSSTLIQNTDASYTLTLKDGTAVHFSSTGLETSVVDLNGNTTAFGYTSSLLTSITDAYSQVTTLAYNSSQPRLHDHRLGQPRDHAGLQHQRPAHLHHRRRLHRLGLRLRFRARLTSITDPLTNATAFTYGAGSRVSGVTRADSSTESLTPAQVRGLPATGTGTSSSPATAYLATEVQATYTDPNGQDWLTRFDWVGYGVATQATDPLGNETVIYRKDCGCPWLMTDPLGQITRTFEDSQMNVIEKVQPDGSTVQATYNSLGEPLTQTDATGAVTTNTYDTHGNLLTVTQPDPDGAGPLTAPVTTDTYTAPAWWPP